MKSRNEHAPIDAVITWVDGEDPIHRDKMSAYLKGKNRAYIPGAAETRFGNANELKYSLISIFRFAPFIRKVFIITDNQDPNIHSAIHLYFPERLDDVSIVDHREIFEGYEQYLPTFNSRSIEAMVWRINGLADQFIFLSDDMFLIRPVQREDLFVNERPIMRGKWLIRPVLRNIWNSLRLSAQHHILHNEEFQPKPSFHLGQWNAAQILGFKTKYFFSSHTPHTVNKKSVAHYFSKHPNILVSQIKHRFRHYTQFNCASLYYHLEIKSGNKYFKDPAFIFMYPYGRSKSYIGKKLQKCENETEALFLNIQSLELCSQVDQEKIITWLEKKLQL
jgi:hypothetical protein